ncbi:hypothetical protein ABQG65_22205 [Yersinia alsatica]|uniref:hypothetical protein n=1 Tax=Yersinia alsatica TaxID=2890317 RepID=UPI0032EC5058
MELLEECKLCGKSAVLQNSHIIPRSYYKRLKRESNQLLIIVDNDEIEPRLSNSDPKEKLLCTECEQFLSVKYESYGTKIFRTSKNVIKQDDRITINGFDYKRFYLYFISILWRASLASNDNFKSITLGDELEDLLKYCIINNRMKLGRSNSLKVDNFLRLSVSRVVDSSNNISDDLIKNVMMNFRVDKGDIEKVTIYYLMLEGFLIVYSLSPGENIHDVRARRIQAQIVNGSSANIIKVEIGELKEIREMFNLAINKSKKHHR